MEALAAGLPVVASDIPPILEIQKFFPNHILSCQVDNIDQYVTNLLEALKFVEHTAIDIQREFENSPFTMDKMITNYANLYGLS